MNTSHYTDGLRELADWLDAHPEWTPVSGQLVCMYVLPETAPEAMARAARDMGSAEKSYNDSTGLFGLEKSFGPHRLHILTEREAVCTRVVTGSHVETKSVPVTFTMETVEVEDVEWICEPILRAAVG
ncbi:MAG: hypothetical protein M0Z46_10625 [Actinomycetota bacterium]|nr:hypothetical protein [Actinomycetota bacterium]